ncbi:DUF4377 domain-containing protein [Arcticibacterium luteifluviistationis]|uniref:DUF4377 domain-containing protein n=1 Tax=Arcticibacterium luteifluviistationis TaxID=1784714 RepID=A0A2Z4GGH2_9BACT|nr:DUF4377 domain-containing protein [Arcticibacterium luteifluviistationis]AWW00292.1 hypothetical protein DJ013_19790 [Arcticibacterium luteifluviistationis]
MILRNTLFIASLAIFSSCATSSSTSSSSRAASTSTEAVYWVNGKKSDCVGVGKKNCLEVQKGDLKNSNNWKLFYESIDGFNYEEGYVYKLLIKEENALKPVPADASLKNYKLVRVIQKEYEPKLFLDNNWTLIELNNAPVIGENAPTIQFNLDLRKMTANDGCNNLVSEIKSVMDDKINLGNVVGTKKMCEEMELANQYGPLLSKINSYKIEDQKLVIYDSNNIEILAFKRSN